jgi:squalene-associated FAD-dependent desaturase
MSTESPKSVVIVGGGLAGLAAGVYLSKRGFRVAVLEKRPFLGGRAFSFNDPETGVEVDNGQHVFVGACSAYMQFLHEIGAWGNVRMPRRSETRVIRNGELAWLRAFSWIPGSAANFPALLRYGHVSFVGRLRLLYGMARIRFARRKPGSALEDETFGTWLRRHGQSDETISRFWNLIVLPALNDDIEDVSADAGLMLFQTAFLGAPSKAAIGYPVVGLSRLAGDSAASSIISHGGEVRTASDVGRLSTADGRATGVILASGEVVQADAVVVALPPSDLQALLSPEQDDYEFFKPAARIETSPIVGIHIWYDRPVLEDRFVAVLDSPLQWVFNVTRMHERETGRDSQSQHIAISLSGAWQWKDKSKAELREVFVAEMARVFPIAANAEVTRFITVKMLEATFRVVPGAERNRLPQETPISGLFLAGDWTRTGWPSTMESAVRSGNLAGEAVAKHLSAIGS